MKAERDRVLGIDACLIKPFELAELAVTVHCVLAQRAEQAHRLTHEA